MPIIFLLLLVAIVVGVLLSTGWLAELLHRPGTGEDRPVTPHVDEQSRPEHLAVTSETLENTDLGESDEAISVDAQRGPDALSRG